MRTAHAWRARRGSPRARFMPRRSRRMRRRGAKCERLLGGSLPCKGTWRLDKPLLFNGFWPSADSPLATEVWFRCAPPHVASLINGNGVDDRKLLLLMSGGVAVASSREAGPL